MKLKLLNELQIKVNGLSVVYLPNGKMHNKMNIDCKMLFMYVTSVSNLLICISRGSVILFCSYYLDCLLKKLSAKHRFHTRYEIL